MTGTTDLDGRVPPSVSPGSRPSEDAASRRPGIAASIPSRGELIRQLRELSTDKGVSMSTCKLLVDASNALVHADRAIQRAAEGFDPHRREAIADALADLVAETVCTMDGMIGDTFSPVEANGIRKAKSRLQDIAFKRPGVQVAMSRAHAYALSDDDAPDTSRLKTIAELKSTVESYLGYVKKGGEAYKSGGWSKKQIRVARFVLSDLLNAKMFKELAGVSDEPPAGEDAQAAEGEAGQRGPEGETS